MLGGRGHDRGLSDDCKVSGRQHREDRLHGQRVSPDDFEDTNGDRIRDLALKDFQIMEVFKKDGTVQFRGGRETVVMGSYLQIVHPDYAVWENATSAFVYPFTFTSDSPWTPDVCAQVPTASLGVA